MSVGVRRTKVRDYGTKYPQLDGRYRFLDCDSVCHTLT
jgi:hypothetical protein